MNRKTVSILMSSLIGILCFTFSNSADAQYHRGYGYRGGYGYGAPPPPPQQGMSFRHRLHGYLGGQVMGMPILAQSGEHDYLGTGGGGGLFGGVRLSPFFSLELNWTFTYHNVTDESYWSTYWYGPGYYESSYVNAWSALFVQTLTLDAKIHIPTYGPVEPYVQAGVGGTFLGASWGDDYYEGDFLITSGPMFNLGGGLDIWLSPFFSVGGRILYRGMRFGEPRQDPKSGEAKYTNYVNAVSIDLNATLHF